MPDSRLHFLVLFLFGYEIDDERLINLLIASVGLVKWARSNAYDLTPLLSLSRYDCCIWLFYDSVSFFLHPTCERTILAFVLV